MLIAAFLIVFVGIASVTRLDAAATGRGTLIVSNERQIVQHRDGGVIGNVRVREGQTVTKGQVLLTLAAPEVQAQERSLQTQYIQLLAQKARLNAELSGLATIATPVEFAALSAQDADLAESAMSAQAKELHQRRAVLSAQRLALASQAGQSADQRRGYDSRRAASAEEMRLIDEQIRTLGPIAAKGFVSQSRMRDLERAKAQVAGDLGQYSANIAQMRGAAAQTRLESAQADSAFLERAAQDLHDVDSKLGDVLPRLASARELLARTFIRAPVSGTVLNLKIGGRGAVIAGGDKLLEIIPTGQPLRSQVRIDPDDADDLKAGMTARVKFPGLHDRRLPDLIGSLQWISADDMIDERTGVHYFAADIVIPESEMRKIQTIRGDAFVLRAGMPTEVLLPLRRRSALDYAVEPLLDNFWRSFHEH